MSVQIEADAPFSDYQTHGWSLCEVPRGSKGPVGKNWHRTPAGDIPLGYNAGLLHSLSGTCAIDVDDITGAMAWLADHGINLEKLASDPSAVRIVSGRQNSGKMLFKTFVPLPSKKIVVGGKTILEFRCASANGESVQDILPPSLHPSGSTYQWRGDWRNLPDLPTDLLSLWLSLINEPAAAPVPTQRETKPIDPEVIRALHFIDPDATYPTWIEVGMALKDEFGDAGLAEWDRWSSRGAKYKTGEAAAKWRSFRDHPVGVTLGTLMHYAREAGYRPAPVDLEALFADQKTPINPEELVRGMITAAPTLDVSLFPPVLARRAQEVSDSVGCDISIPVWAGMSAICAAVDARCRLELVPGFEVPPVLWVMTIGAPADKKSPGSKPMFKALTALEKADTRRYQQALLQWEGAEASYAASKKAYLQHAADPMHVGPEGEVIDAPVVHDLPKAPVPLRFTLNDTTSQKLVRLAAERPEGMLCVLDEMSGWVDRVTDKTSGDDRSCWVQAYESDKYILDRVGTGTLVAENLAISIYGNLQPTPYARALRNMGEDGMLQRFVPVPLRGDQTRLGNPVPEYLTNNAAWEEMLRNVHAQAKGTYTLCSEGAREFRTFQEWYEGYKRVLVLAGESDHLLTAYGKLEGLVGRVALVLHVAKSPTRRILDADTMREAIDIVGVYVLESLKHCLSDIGGMAEGSLDVWVMRHIIQIADEGTVTLSDVRRSARRKVEHLTTAQADEAIRAVLGVLQVRGYVMLTEDNGRSVTYAINPKLSSMFKEYREKVIKAKVDAKEHRENIVRSKGMTPKAHKVRGAAGTGPDGGDGG